MKFHILILGETFVVEINYKTWVKFLIKFYIFFFKNVVFFVLFSTSFAATFLPFNDLPDALVECIAGTDIKDTLPSV